MDNDKPFIEFPLSYPLKVLGLNNEALIPAILAIFRRHLGQEEFTYTSRTSSGGKYLSLTVTFMARSKAQLDALYLELNAHELVVMTL